MSLRGKLLLPLIVTLLLLGGASLYGSLQLLDEASIANVDQRLRAAQEVLFRQFKQQEDLLLDYCYFLEQFDFLNARFQDSHEINILQDRLFAALEKEGISVLFYPAEPTPGLSPVLHELIQQSVRSRQPRFRYTDQLNALPTLVVAAPLYAKGEPTRIMVLACPIGNEFLAKTVTPLGLAASLHNLDGKTLAQSGAEVTPVELNSAQIMEIGRQGRIFVEHDTPAGGARHLFTLIPLGTSDLVMLSVESSLREFTTLQETMLVRLALTICGAMLLGAIIYFRALATIVQPARELVEAAKAVSRGNFAYRIVDISDDELGEVSRTFNQMAEQIDNIYQDKTDKEMQLVIAQEEAKTKAIVDRKNHEVEKVNEELRTHLRELSALYQLNQAMVSVTDLSIMFDRVLQTIIETLSCDQVIVLLYSPKENLLKVVRFAGLSSNTIEGVEFHLDQGITGQAAQSQKLIYISDVHNDERYLNYHGKLANRGSFVSSPLTIKGRLLGVLNLHKREVGAFTASELKMIQAISNQLAIAIENVQLLEKARENMSIDDLTGLANRRYFQDILKREVAQARRFNTSFSIVMCAIDHFAQYQSRHGRMQSDALLRQIGQLLLNHTRSIDLVCRFSNENFVMLLPKTAKPGGMATADKLRATIAGETFYGAADSQPGGRLTVSFGIAEFPTDSKNIYELINLADQSLHQAMADAAQLAGSSPPLSPSAE